MKQVLLLGGNQGDVIAYMKNAVKLLSRTLGLPQKQSGYYESEPWGFEADQNFINQVVEFDSDVLPEQLLQLTQGIEKKSGRQQKLGKGYESRPLDIDILFIDNEVIDLAHLQIPHPRLHLRRFTLLPLMEYWRELQHPTLELTLEQLLENCPDQSDVKKVQ